MIRVRRTVGLIKIVQNESLRVVQSLDFRPKLFWNQCRKEADPTQKDSEIKWWNRFEIRIQIRNMSDPPLSDIDLKNGLGQDYP